jgi:hypothetical protein
MDVMVENQFRSPYGVPNGLQLTDEGIWVVDQITDRVALMSMADEDKDDYYGHRRLLKDIPSESSNTSGLAYGDGSLWLAANGPGKQWRLPRDTDAPEGEILRVDPNTGETQGRWAIPTGGGTHGLEFDNIEPGTIWVTTLKEQTITQMRIEDWSVIRSLDLPLSRAHGVVRFEEDSIWVVHTGDRVIVKLDLASNAELDRIVVPEPNPEPHGLSICEGGFLYCDATSGWVSKISW